ncbi:DDRGK1 [Branchiostoma lanceolatum]|uniref:DDRGK domain-containing protein 1 n=1 Tax=Branchiostoma lanceolatum TaxID=7740 RepID=A0A8J9ZMX8_BRALA|nr:DDRGK1 [Branchiostoma lanceolatum]
MVDPAVLYAVAAVFVAILLFVAVKLRGGQEQEPADEDGQRRGAPRPRTDVERAAGAPRRVRGARQRLQAARRMNQQDSEGDSDSDEGKPEIDIPEGMKVGAKKMKKLEMKAEKKAAREAAEQEREDRKQREKALEEKRKQEEEEEKLEEERRAEEERKAKEEQAAREHEEYLMMKGSFTVEEEGHEEILDEDATENLLQDFIDHIKAVKVVLLEDLAAQFNMRTQDCIQRVQELREQGRLTGVIDDRGKFIYISQDELQAVAKFIKQRGRVSISDLVESSNQLINLIPDTEQVIRAQSS